MFDNVALLNRHHCQTWPQHLPGSGPGLLLPVEAVVPVAEGDGAGGGLQDGAPAAALLSGHPVSIPAAALLWPRHPAAAGAEGAARNRLGITCLELTP